MIKIDNEKDCCGCEACRNICPKQCISMEVKEGFYYPRVCIDKCINCNLCEKVCPVLHHKQRQFELQIGVAAYVNDDIIRYQSTSGGIAYILSREVVKDGGIAYGVVFDEEFKTVFSSARTIDELKKLQGSKYPQSVVGNIFQEIKKNVYNGRKVIFIGTPCQTYGLHNFLGQTYDNLVLIDLICHGVPSPELWNVYLKELFPNDVIKNVVFKNKEAGWKKWHVKIETEKNTYTKERTNDYYMSSYLCGYNVRPSCFACHFKNSNRVSDITIADAWGLPEKDKELNDDKGLSSLIINTEKGKKLFYSITNNINYKFYSVEDLIRGNMAYQEAMTPNYFRKYFIKTLKKKGVLKTLKMYAITSPKGKVYGKVSNCIWKIRRK